MLLPALAFRSLLEVSTGGSSPDSPTTNLTYSVPDFRSSHGLFKSLRSEHKIKASGKHLFDASVYKHDSSTSSFHDMVRSLSSMASTAKPTAFHRLLARLSSEGRLLRLYTQNVDGIDTSLPPLASQVPLGHKAPWPKTVQLHGGLEKMVCQKCRHTSDFQPELFQGPEPPLCPECTEKDSVRTMHAGKRSHGIGKLRPRIVLYNEHNPDEEAIGAIVTSDLRSRPDAVLVVGTSLKIPGVRRIVREMCGVTRARKNGITIWVNQDPVPVSKDFDSCWDIVVKGDCDEVARRAALKEWDEPIDETVDECTSSDIERVKQEQGPISVVVHSPSKKAVLSETGIMTPPISHDEMGDHRAARKISLKKTTNPASLGRSIADVLGKESRVKKTPSASVASRGRKAEKTSTSQKTIAAKVTKGAGGRREEKPKALPVLPIVPVSPQASRNNGPVLFPNLQQKPSSFDPTPPDSPSSETWRDRETISPTGSIPADMIRLLN